MHKPAMSLPVVAAGLLAILLIGCSDETSPTPITTPTPSPVPTATPEPTATPSPVPTPIPTPQTAKSPPPIWIFARDISEEYRTILRDEMEAVRAWFSAQHDIEASHFTVLVGATDQLVPPPSPLSVSFAVSDRRPLVHPRFSCLPGRILRQALCGPASMKVNQRIGPTFSLAKHSNGIQMLSSKIWPPWKTRSRVSWESNFGATKNPRRDLSVARSAILVFCLSGI